MNKKDVRRGEGGPQARTPRLPVRCVENANGLRAGSSAEVKVMGVATFLCPLGSSGRVCGPLVAARELVVWRFSTETCSQGSRGSTHHDSGRQRELSGRDAAKYAPHTQAPEPTAACLQGATGLAQGSGAVAYCSAKNAETASLHLDAWTPPVGTPTVRKCHESGREQGWEALPFLPDENGPMTDMPMAPPQAMT
jgi:hypothetical protein